MLGKSFKDIGAAIVGRINDINNAFQATDDLIGSIKDSDSIWKRLYQSKDSIKSQLKDVETLYPSLSDEQLSLILTKFVNINKEVTLGKTNWQDYFTELKEGEEWQIDFVQNTDLQKASLSDVKKAYNSARTSALAHNEAIKAQTLSAKTGSAALKGLSIAASTLVSIGLNIVASKVMSFLYDMVTANEQLLNSAKELGETFRQERDLIEGYKNRISELQGTINDSSASFDDVSQARRDLIDIQNELIKKFGTEKGTIEIITEAINEQSDALDLLTQKQYQQWKNEFNNKSFGQTASDFFASDNTANAFYKLTELDFSGAWNMLTAPTESNIDKMVSSMQHAYYEIKKTGNDTLDYLIAKTYDLHDTGSSFVLSGNLNDIYEDLLGIQELTKDFDVSDRFESSVTRIANAMSKNLSSYKEAYNQYVLFEKILNGNSDNQYDEQFDLINKAKDAYDNALVLNDSEKIKAASNEYAQTLQSAIDLAMSNSDSDVADYFKSMYPELQQMFGEWQFNINFGSNTDGIKDKITNALDSIDGESDGTTSFSVEDIKNFNPNNATQEQITAYGELKNIAETLYGLTLPQLICSLQELGLVQSEIYQQLVNTFGQGNIDKLSPEDLEIAYAIENVGNMTFEQLQAAIEKTKESADENPFSPLSPSDTINQLNTQLKPAMDSLKSAWQDIFTDDGFALDSIDIISTCDSIKSKLDELNEIEGITVDYSAYEHFIDVLNNSDSTVDNVKESFNNLASSITQAGLSGAEDFETMKAALEDLGVVNEDLVAFDALISNTEALKEAGLDLASATEEQIAKFADEMVSADNLTQAIDMLTFTKLASNAANMDTSTEVANLRTLAENAGYTGDVIQYLTELEDIYQGLTSGTIPSADIPGKLERAKELTALIQESASNIKYEPEIDYSNATRSAARAGKEAGKSYSDALKDELSNLNDVVGAIGNIINNQIDLYNDQKDAAVDALEAQKEAAEEALEAEKALVQEQIDAKQAEIDKIKEAAEARKNDIDLQQKQYELARLQNQRTILVYSEDKGMHYVQDTKEIRSAKEAVTEAQENIQIAGLEKEISGLESIIDSLDQKIEESNKYYDDLIDQTEKYWDSLIKGLEDYKFRWDELTEIEEQAKVLALLEQMGISTDDVLNMSESAFQGFKESYLGLLGEMYKGNDQMVESLSKITDVDMSSLNGYLATTKESIDTLQNTDLSNLSDSFDNLAASAGNVSSAINGSGGYSVQSSESGENPAGASSGSSLKSAIKDQTESAIEDLTTQKELFNGDGGLTSAVQEVIDKIGGGSGGEESAEGSQGSEGDSNNLTSALKEQTEEALNEETGIPAQKRAWEELNEPLGQAIDHITTIKSTLEDLDGRTFTVTLNVEGNGGSIASGGITGVFGGVLPIRGNVGVNGTAHIKGSANAKGNWGAKKGGRTLVGELGQELWVHSADGTFETVGNNGAEFINLKPNDIIFNHLQTKQLLDKGNIIGRGKSYAGGTASGNTINTLDGATVTSDGHVLKPIRPGDSVWELQKAFEPLLQKIDGNLEYLAGNAIIEHTRQLEKMISRPNTTSAVTNRNIQPVIHQNIALNCPNVTNNSGIEYIQKELGHLSQMAMQEPIKKY